MIVHSALCSACQYSAALFFRRMSVGIGLFAGSRKMCAGNRFTRLLRLRPFCRAMPHQYSMGSMHSSSGLLWPPTRRTAFCSGISAIRGYRDSFTFGLQLGLRCGAYSAAQLGFSSSLELLRPLVHGLCSSLRLASAADGFSRLCFKLSRKRPLRQRRLALHKPVELHGSRSQLRLCGAALLFLRRLQFSIASAWLASSLMTAASSFQLPSAFARSTSRAKSSSILIQPRPLRSARRWQKTSLFPSHHALSVVGKPPARQASARHMA